MKPLINALIFLSLMIAPLMSIAESDGADSSGGGDIITCNPPGWFNKKYYLADTYQLKLKGLLNVDNGISEEILVETYFDSIKAKEPELGKALYEKYESLTFIPQKKKLKELDDDDITDFSADCRKGKKHQFAIQNLRTGVVRYRKKFWNKITNVERALFKIHEAFIALEKRPGETTTHIREKVAEIAANKEFYKFLANTVFFEKELFPNFWFFNILYRTTNIWGLYGWRGYTTSYGWCDALSKKNFIKIPISTFHINGSSMNGSMKDARLTLIYSVLKNFFGDWVTGTDYSKFTSAFNNSKYLGEFAIHLEAISDRKYWVSRESILNDMERNRVLIDLFYECSPPKSIGISKSDVLRQLEKYKHLVETVEQIDESMDGKDL